MLSAEIRNKARNDEWEFSIKRVSVKFIWLYSHLNLVHYNFFKMKGPDPKSSKGKHY